MRFRIETVVVAAAAAFAWSISIAAPLLAAAPSPAAEKESARRRWAVVSSKACQANGLSDLFKASLSDAGGIELVERDDLKLAVKELELSALFGSENASRRLKLGRILKADALVILSIEKRADAAFVKMIVSECRHGARLRTEFQPFRPADVEQIAGRLAAVVSEVRRRIGDGVTHLLCVPPFLSKNLTHDYDHLQVGYASLLISSLERFPGVAVVEVEEARAIDRELRLTAENLKDRVVPLFVEGEFKMSAAKPGDKPKVQMTLSLVDAQHGRKRYEQPPLSFDEVTDLLTRRAPEGILRRAKIGPQKPLTRQQQTKLLSDRAEVFSLIGARPHSIGLREAALLLSPDDVKMRLALIRD
ncbi:MAG: CsgG/HfaB family protein, partial [Planctomycetales bacterium]